MTKKEFWKGLSPDQRKALAESLETSTEYLRLVFMHNKKTGPQRARSISAFSGGALGAHEFCPSAFDEADSLNIKSGQRASA